MMTNKIVLPAVAVSAPFWLMLMVGLCLWSLPGVARASAVVMVTPPEVDSYTTIDEPALKRSYFGTLTGFPHTYRFTLTEQTEVTFQIAEPDIFQPAGAPSVIVVHEVERGVEEVARLSASEVGKEAETVYATGDTYRLGERFTELLQPGAYLVEVSNGDNEGKYVLHFGSEAVDDGLGYVGTLKQVYAIKRFFDKPAIMVLQSPYYYVPTMLLLVAGLWWYRRRQQRAYA
jgi:hypothetical protein